MNTLWRYIRRLKKKVRARMPQTLTNSPQFEFLEERTLLTGEMIPVGAYFTPLSPGATWSYTGTEDGESATRVDTVGAATSLHGSTSFPLISTFPSDPSFQDTFFYHLDDSGLHQHRQEEVEPDGAGFSDINPPINLLPSIVEVGRTYNFNGEFEGEITAGDRDGTEFEGDISGSFQILSHGPLTVPAGTFEDVVHILYNRTDDAQFLGGTEVRQTTEDLYYAKDIGLIKTVESSTFTRTIFGEVTVTDSNASFELTSTSNLPMPVADQFLPGGLSNGIATDQNGVVHVAYHDINDGALKYATHNPASGWSASTIIDDQSQEVGIYVNMALDANGSPGVAYYDAFNGDLKYAHFNGTSWTVEAVQTRRTVGLYPSLQFDTANHPNVAYYNKSQGNLLFAQKQGVSWIITEVETQDDVGRYASLQWNDITGRWAVAYENTSDGRFRYAEQDGAGGWNINTIDPTLGGGGFTSLVFASDGTPAVSYYDAHNADLKFARFINGNWQTQPVAQKRSQGLYTTLFYQNNQANILFFNKSTNALVRASGTGAPGAWAFDTLASGGGRWARGQVMPNGQLLYSWFESGTQGVNIQRI